MRGFFGIYVDSVYIEENPVNSMKAFLYLY